MVTMVGTQKDFAEAMAELLKLDYEATEAYQAAIDRLKNHVFKENLKEFKLDHERHIRELTELIIRHGGMPPQGPDMMKQYLLKGKVVIANILGDEAILRAMSSNETDTNTAYERITVHQHKWEDATDVLQRGLMDEKRHKAWLEANIS